jgi:hypothetical protein
MVDDLAPVPTAFLDGAPSLGPEAHRFQFHRQRSTADKVRRRHPKVEGKADTFPEFHRFLLNDREGL